LITGIVLTIVFLFVMPIVFQKLEIRGYQYYSAKNIFARAGEIMQGLLDVGQFSTSPSTSTIFIDKDVPSFSPDTSL